MAPNVQIFPAGKNVEAQYVEMKVPLYSYGCEKKVKKALSHLRGIHSVHVDYKLQKVTVWGICDKDDVLATIRKKRRDSSFWINPKQEKQNTTTKDKEETEIKDKLDGVEEDPQSPPQVLPNSLKSRKSWKKLLIPSIMS